MDAETDFLGEEGLNGDVSRKPQIGETDNDSGCTEFLSTYAGRTYGKVRRSRGEMESGVLGRHFRFIGLRGQFDLEPG